MQPKKIVEKIATEFSGFVHMKSWGETSLFYNLDRLLPNGVYFFTIKEKNGANDKASSLDREGIYRLSIGISKERYESLFSARPKRPSKGGIIDTEHDFTECNILMPHPIYGWMSWVQILNPSDSMFEEIFELIAEAHARAVIKFNKKLLSCQNSRTQISRAHLYEAPCVKKVIFMFMIEYKDIGWWYWLATAPLLTIGVLGNELGFILAIGLTLFQLIHYVIREESIKAFPIQVRFWYLLLLIVSFPEIMQWLYWVPCIGTWAQVLFGYCAMARLVSLWPWNREEPLTFKLFSSTFLSPPVRGSVQQGFAESK